MSADARASAHGRLARSMGAGGRRRRRDARLDSIAQYHDVPASSLSSTSYAWLGAEQEMWGDEDGIGGSSSFGAGRSRGRGVVSVSNAAAEEERAWGDMMRADYGNEGFFEGGGRGDYLDDVDGDGAEDDLDDDDVYEWESNGGGGGGGGRAGGGVNGVQESLTQDWDKPTLDTVFPAIQIPWEGHVFPLSMADDGEALPSELHPSYPFSNPFEPISTDAAYMSRPKLAPRLHFQYRIAGETQAADGGGGNTGGDDGEPGTHGGGMNARRRRQGKTKGRRGRGHDSMRTSKDPLPMHISLRAQHETRPNEPIWPFRRFGPGPGGQTALARAETMHPWRPYKDVWTDLGLQEIWKDEENREQGQSRGNVYSKHIWADEAHDDVDPLKMPSSRAMLRRQRKEAEVSSVGQEASALDGYGHAQSGNKLNTRGRRDSGSSSVGSDIDDDDSIDSWVWGRGRV